MRLEHTAIRIPLALIGIGAVGAGAALVLAMGAAVQRATVEGSLTASHVAARHLASALEDQGRAITGLANLLEEIPGLAEREARLRTWLSAHPLTFSCLALVASGGDMVEFYRPKGTASYSREVGEVASAAMARRGLQGTLVGGRDRRAPLVLMAAPIRVGRERTGHPDGALVACLDTEGLVTAALDGLSGDGEAVAFLTEEKSELAVVSSSGGTAGGEEVKGATARAELIRVARDSFFEGVSTRVLPSGGLTLLAVAVRFDAAGSAWAVGVARPWRLSVGDTNRFVLMAAFGVVVFLAGAAGVAAALRRAQVLGLGEGEEGNARRKNEAANWRGPWQRALLALPGHPVVGLQGTRIAEANAWAARFLGVDAAPALAGRDLLEFVADSDREDLARILSQETTAEGNEQTTVRFDIKGTGKRVADVWCVPPEEGQSGTLLVTWRDRTAGERGEALARTLAKAMHVPIVFVDSAGAVVWSNQAFDVTARRLGVTRTDVLGVFRPTEQRLLKIMFGAALRGRSMAKLLPLNVGSGKELAVAVRAAPATVAGDVFGVVFAAEEVRGAPPGAVSLTSDRRAEALAQLAATLSHRLNNDVQALQGRISTARLAGRTVTAEEIVPHLQAATGELQRFVTVCRRSASALRPVRLSVLLNGWQRTALPSIPPGVRLVLASEVTEDRVIVDSRQIESFLDYAVLATSRGLEREGGAVYIAVERGEIAGTVRLSVRDTGGEGVGLGDEPREGLSHAMAREAVLAVGQLVAERHGGAAGWRRRAGMGSHVWLDIPLRVGAVPEVPAGPPERRPGVVLVADDEEWVRTSLATALREEGFVVDEASNGQDALEMIKENPQRYALLVLDLVMPVMDGRAVLQRLGEEAVDLPVLLCTGYEPAGDEGLAGVDSLVKPFSLEVFVERVRDRIGTPAAAVLG